LLSVIEIKTLALLSLISTHTLINSSHPIIIVILIRAQTLILCLAIRIITQTPWFSFILFLVFMGGLIVLFIYISSLASNERFSIEAWWRPYPKLIGLRVLGISFSLLLENTQAISLTQIKIRDLIFKLYSPGILTLTTLTIFYLLLVLIVIVNITSLQEGPLRAIS